MIVNATPRLRNDLEAQSVEEAGIKYFDVRDPRSGNKMRMYDFEWLIAGQLDGHKKFDEVAAWAADKLGVKASATDLQSYASKLEQYGFFDGGASVSSNGTSSSEVSIDMNDDLDAENTMRVDAPRGVVMGGNADPLRATEARPVSPAETPSRPAPVATPAASRPERAEPSAAGQLPKPEGPSGSVIALVLLLLLGGAAAVYFKFLAEGPVQVKVEVAAPKEVTRLYDGNATVKMSQPQTLSFGEGGTVAEVVAKGTAVKQGQVVASLEGGAKFDKELQDIRDRLAYYQKKVDAAKAKNDEAAAKESESKVAEKQKLLNDTEAKAAKVRLVSPTAGTVTEVMVAAGAEAKAGAPVVKLGDSRKVAELKLAAPEAAALKPGATLTLQGKAGVANGRVQSVADGLVTIELLDEVLKDGEQVKVVKARVANVIKLPPAAVLKVGADDVVYVLVNGEAKQRKVKVADRSTSEILVSGGLAPGDTIIVSSPTPMADGMKATQ